MAKTFKINDEEPPDVEELLPIRELVSDQLSASHLRLLLRTGKIKGKKIGRDWFTTAKAINEYLQLGIKPGPKPRT
jgi:hypothetical protein